MWVGEWKMRGKGMYVLRRGTFRCQYRIERRLNAKSANEKIIKD